MAYEDEHYPLAEPSKEDADLFRLEQQTGVELRPVVIKGETILYDMYAGGKWIGSRRTISVENTVTDAWGERRGAQDFLDGKK